MLGKTFLSFSYWIIYSPADNKEATGIVAIAATFVSTKQTKGRNCDHVLINTRLLERGNLGALEHILASHHLENFQIYHRNGRKYPNCHSVECRLLTFGVGPNVLQQRL